MALAATPVSTAAEQQHQYDDNQEQFHGEPPLMILLARRSAAHLVKQRAQDQIFDARDQTKRARDQIVPKLSVVELTAAV
jgi:hypothetical protein